MIHVHVLYMCVVIHVHVLYMCVVIHVHVLYMCVAAACVVCLWLRGRSNCGMWGYSGGVLRSRVHNWSIVRLRHNDVLC